MISTILPYMRCPRCSGGDLRQLENGLSCAACHADYSIRDGILDMMTNDEHEVITPFQRLMQSRLLVSVYELFWRQVGYYLASSRSFTREMRTVTSIGSRRSGRLALDLACGTGVFTRPLARVGEGIVIGLDLSRPMLAHAQRLMKRDGLSNVLFMRASAFCMPFADGVFPYVNCCGALHLFDQPDAALEEIRRILKPGGGLCVQTTIRPEHSVGVAYLLEHFIRFGFFGESEIVEKLKSHGFRVVESERHRISFTFLATRTGS